MTVGQVVFVQTGGYYTVASKADTTHVVLTNLGYAGNTAPASTGNGGNVSPGGVIGATGPSFSLIGGMGETTKYLRAVGSKTYVGMHNNLGAVTAANEANVQSAIPVAGKVTRLTVQIVTTAGVPTPVGGTAGTTIMRFTVRKSTGGGAFTSEAVTCDAGSTATGCTASSSLSASFAAGDLITIEAFSAGTTQGTDNLFVRWSAAFSAD